MVRYRHRFGEDLGKGPGIKQETGGGARVLPAWIPAAAQMRKLDLLTQLVFTARFAWSDPEAVFALRL